MQHNVLTLGSSQFYIRRAANVTEEIRMDDLFDRFASGLREHLERKGRPIRHISSSKFLRDVESDMWISSRCVANMRKETRARYVSNARRALEGATTFIQFLRAFVKLETDTMRFRPQPRLTITYPFTDDTTREATIRFPTFRAKAAMICIPEIVEMWRDLPLAKPFYESIAS